MCGKSFNRPLEAWLVVINMSEMFKDSKAFSHYPKRWGVPADQSEEMFTGTKVEEKANKLPLNTRVVEDGEKFIFSFIA